MGPQKTHFKGNKMDKKFFKFIFAWIFIIIGLILFSIPIIYSIRHDNFTDMQILKKFWLNYISSIISVLISKLLLSEIEKEIIDLRGENVKLRLTDIEGRVIVDDIVFEVFDIKVRKLAANNKLSFVLENMYDKETEKKIVDCRFDDVILYMTIIDQTLFDQVDDIEDIESQE